MNIVTDRDSGQPRGFAFVEMPNDAEGERAIETINGREVGGRALNVNEARPKGEGGGRGFGGADRGSGGGGFPWRVSPFSRRAADREDAPAGIRRVRGGLLTGRLIRPPG